VRHRLAILLAILAAAAVSAAALAESGYAASAPSADAAKKAKKCKRQAAKRAKRCAKRHPRRVVIRERRGQEGGGQQGGGQQGGGQQGGDPNAELGYVEGPEAEREVKQRLGGAVFTSCETITCGNETMYLRRLHVCSDGTFILQGHSGKDPEVTGSWSISWSRLTPTSAQAYVTALLPSLVTTIDVLWVYSGSVRIDGNEVRAGRSERCS
jgi:hypothetical protein